MTKLLVGLIRIYQKLISPVLVGIAGPICRFDPSCSQYAIEAIGKHGPVKGAYYAVHRVMRCHPFTKGGYDPVP